MREREEREEKRGEGEEVVETLPVVEQLPLADLDTQQEMMLLLLRKKIEGLEEEEKAHLAEGEECGYCSSRYHSKYNRFVISVINFFMF